MGEVTRANTADVGHILPLFEAYRVFYGQQPDADRSEAFLKERLERDESVIYLAEIEGTPVGFAQCYPIFTSTRCGKMWLLNDLYVDEAHRGKGLSKQLIAKCQELCKSTGAAAILIETAKDNAIANKAYPATGFQLLDHNFYEWENPDFCQSQS
jgi:GNAT superfamily N-acetyltransferase